MTDFDWAAFLREWSGELIGNEDIAGSLPPEVKASDWLGFPGASDEQIGRAEARLGKPLSPSYRGFLKASNGWRATGFFVDRLWSTDDIEWSGSVIRNGLPIGSGGAAQYPPQDLDSDGHYLPSVLEISDVGDSAIYLMNPQIVAGDGEWQAWFFSNWNPGAVRHRSFQELMVAERQSFLYVRDHRR